MNNVLTQHFVPNLTINEFLDECKIFVDSYSCPLCEGILLESVIDKCGHSFCKECMNTLLKETSKCPFTNNELKPPLSLNIIVNSVIEKQKVYCKNRGAGCGWIGKLSERKLHLSNDCTKEIIQCENYPNCTFKAPRDEVQIHLTQCEFRTIKCEYCEEKILYKNIEDHIKQCPNAPVECSNKCGMKVPLSKINYHIQNECGMTAVECPFGVVGCEFYDLRKTLKDHLDRDLERHLRMITAKISSLEKLISTQGESIKAVTLENQTLKQEIESLNDKLLLSNKNTHDTISKLQLELNKTKSYSIIPFSNYVPLFTEVPPTQKIIKIDPTNLTIQKISENVGWYGISSSNNFNTVKEQDKIIVNMKIIKTANSCIMFGVTFSDEHGPLENGFYHQIFDKSYIFYCFNCAVYSKGVVIAEYEKEKTCNEGDIISIIFDINESGLEFRRNGKLMHSKIRDIDMNKMKICVDLSDYGDEVMFLKN